MPLSDRARERLEQTALHPGKSAEDRRAASDLRRVIYSTRSMPPSAQSDLVRPFVNHPTGKEARAAAALTRDPDFRKASTSERELMASVFPSTSPATARALPALTRQLSQTNLSKAEREQVLRHACSEQRDAPTREATRDVMRALKGQPEAAKNALLEPFTKPWLTEARAEGAQALVKSPAWKQLGPTERTQLAQVFSEAPGHEGLRSVKVLSQKPERLMDRDATGGTLLSNLARLAKGPLHPGVGESRRGELMRGVLQETSRAYQVNQSGFGTCTVTSMQYELVRDNPAEYARIVAGLAGPNGRVDMRGGGTLELQADSLPENALLDRSFSEALFQSSLMEFANGADEYHVQGPHGDESIRPDGTTYQGQYGDGMVRASSALFGKPFTDWSTTDLSRDAQLDFLRKYQPKGPNDPVLISFDTNGAAVEGGGHAVTFVKVEGDRVFFRNPWGPTADPKGTEEDFGARVEKGSTGLYSFSLEQFRERVYALTVPSEAAGFGGRAVA
ncbi:hypothetical protein D7W79_27230 [Corallococcus exercitus]|uniref:hypothetical protein n=1 Tax=Corallococcus exercitus TaxID=2316736 RepID=UPI000EA083F3|nr:hypothetical protein [Corallococcus exercitus]RKG72830.1 hypothetical protein D7W79_27230 [Corallococcus exercitus]